jgi:hypothetical protein
MCGFIRRRPGEKPGSHLYAAPDFPQMLCSANNVARSCDCNMAFRRGDDLVRGREKFTTSAADTPVVPGAGQHDDHADLHI